LEVGRDRPRRNQLLHREPPAAEAPDGQDWSVQAERRDHAVDPRTVAQSSVYEWAGLVDSSPERAQNTLDDVHQRLLGLERDIGRFDPAGAFDQDSTG